MDNFKSEKNQRYLSVITLVIISIGFFLMNSFTPLFCDDWHYNFIFGTQRPIETIGDIFKSQWIHYNEFNGRYVLHCFVQLFDSLLGKDAFNIVNTVFFAVFIYMLSNFVVGKRNNRFIAICITFISVVLCFVGFNHVFLWMSGACNYLWTAVFLLFYNVLMHKNIESKIFYPLLFLYGIFCGWTNEGLIIGLAAGYFIYYLCHIKELSASKISLLLGFFIGAILLVFAPGSIHRAVSENTSFDIMSFCRDVLSTLSDVTILRTTFVFFVLLFIMNKKQKINLKEFIKENQILAIAICVTFVFLLMIKQINVRSAFGIEFFALILLLKLVSQYKINKKVVSMLTVAIFAFLSYVIYWSNINYSHYEKAVCQLEQPDREIILTNKPKIPFCLKPYIIQNFYYLAGDIWIAHHFGKEEFKFVPENIYNDIVEHPNHYNEFDYKTPFPYYIKKVNTDKVNSVTFNLDKFNFDEKPFFLQFLLKKMQRYTLESLQTDSFQIVTINGEHYVFINKNEAIDNRIKEIIVD